MRWPVRLQLLLWMLGVVGLGIVLTTATSAYLAVREASRYQAESLDRVVRTLTAAHYPLSQTVLEHVSGLSGAQFVVLDARRRVLYATVSIDAADVATLVAAGEDPPSTERFSQASVFELQSRDYFVDVVPRAGQDPYAGVRWLVVLYPRERWWAVARQVATPILLAGGVTGLFAVLVAAAVAGRLVRPIRALRNQAEAIAAGRFQPIAAPQRNDEFADLAQSINSMTERLAQYETEVRQSERLRTLGQLGVGMAHQLRNSATGARMALELLDQQAEGTTDDENVAVALRQLQLMESYLKRFVAFGRHEPTEHAPVDLDNVVAEAVKLVQPACGHAKVTMEVVPASEPLCVSGDRDALVQLLMNLVLNAFEAAERPGRPEARIRIEVDRGKDRWAELRVTDTGPGPAPAVADRLFEPFVTEKPDGTGLGLYFARQVAEAHGGTVDWRRNADRTCFTVRLPAAPLPGL
ncbi:MAG: ATP-binding protein [Thermoguttaceae bacterium]